MWHSPQCCGSSKVRMAELDKYVGWHLHYSMISFAIRYKDFCHTSCWFSHSHLQKINSVGVLADWGLNKQDESSLSFYDGRVV